MAAVAGARSERVALVRELLTNKGRREQQRFAFEGPTLLEEALRSGAQILEIFATDAAYRENASVREAEAGGTDVFTIDERTLSRISDVETPSGIVAVAALRCASAGEILHSKLSLVLAGLNDPGNAGTLLRSLEAFGGQGAVFGEGGVDPYHPKVVRAAMGAIFRLGIATGSVAEVEEAAGRAEATLLGLDMAGEDIRSVPRSERTALVVGHERRGLGPWETLCTRRVSIPMTGPAESLNAAVAGSIALYALATA